MRNDQYHIPGQLQERPLETALHTADVAQYTPENEAEVFRSVVEVAQRIWNYRQAAIEFEMSKRKGLLSSFGIIRKEPTTQDLIEKESKIGGELYGKNSGRRFWLDAAIEKETPSGSREVVSHWYYTHPIISQDGKSDELALHFELSTHSLMKLYTGKAYTLSIEETENFCKLVEAYEKAVREALYPLEESIHEMQEEIDQDHAPAPSALEEANRHAIVERLIEKAKQNQALTAVQASQASMDARKDDFDLAA